MRTGLIVACVLLLAGCGLQLGAGPNQPRDIATRTYDEFFPQPSVQVALTNPPPGMDEAKGGVFVAERMKTPASYGINFTPPGKEAFGDQVATWSFTPVDDGVRIEVVMSERDRRMVRVSCIAPNASQLALTEAIRVLTVQVYAQIVQAKF